MFISNGFTVKYLISLWLTLLNESVKFTYQEFEIKPSPSSRKKKTIYRPIIPVIMMSGKNLVGYRAVVDSGSDYCVFEAQVALYLGINLTAGNKRKIRGIGGNTIKGYEHKVLFKVAGKQYETKVIFSKQIPENSFGVLGSQGLFDNFKVIFNYPTYIEVA